MKVVVWRAPAILSTDFLKELYRESKALVGGDILEATTQHTHTLLFTPSDDEIYPAHTHTSYLH